MTSFLQGSLATILYGAMKDTVAYDVTLVRKTRVDDGSGGYTTTSTNVTAKGFVADYRDFYRMQGLVEDGDRQVFLFQPSIAGIKPQVGEQVIARGETFNIILVGEDPAQALWELQARPA